MRDRRDPASHPGAAASSAVACTPKGSGESQTGGTDSQPIEIEGVRPRVRSGGASSIGNEESD